jgi:hypothetical protein
VEKRKFLNLPVLEFRPLGRPPHSQSLYRLRYPGRPFYFSTQLNSMHKYSRFRLFMVYIITLSLRLHNVEFSGWQSNIDLKYIWKESLMV